MGRLDIRRRSRCVEQCGRLRRQTSILELVGCFQQSVCNSTQYHLTSARLQSTIYRIHRRFAAFFLFLYITLYTFGYLLPERQAQEKVEIK